MPNYDFSQPQRQSGVGLILIFATSLYHIARNLWVLIFYFFVGKFSTETVMWAAAGLLLVIMLSLGYSILYFLKFKFHIDQKNEEFVLQKGVFSTDVINIPFKKIQQVNFKRNILQRVIGVYSVVVETAGSQDKEVEIKALSRDKANELAGKLMAHAEYQNSELEDEEPVTDATANDSVKKELPDWEHKVSLLTLIKLGSTSNYLRGVGIIIAFYFTLKEQFMFNEELSAQLQEPQAYFAQGKFVLIMLLLVVGMLLTVGETVMKYFGLHLQKYRDNLQVEMGLRNNTRVNLRASRIQLLQVLSNPIQKRLNLFQVKISLASSEDDLEKNQIKIVGLPEAVVGQVKEYFYREPIVEELSFVPSKYLLFRKVFRSMMPLLIIAALLPFFPALLFLNWMLLLAGAYVLLVNIYNYLDYKNLKLGVSKNFLVRYSGVWIHKEEYLEMFRLQAISVSQPLWYKRRGLLNITFHSAGGDISFKLIKKSEATPLLNFLTYKIESSEKAWM
ncbi:PH domain-containing protein [Salinimicrobium oceani]|uniref:PH domain-containing protein n=1 Tax=Salinimicrobium oceani TaxID=2722702 RepID=A0ABX1D2D3_9FLAO|nr:PH domain-containing protein [Salinimicrobium oceani]NJW53492.1 PH domain-containing protein [Salinimicrobium oceani]